MRVYKVTDIQYDADGVDLPKEMEITVPTKYCKDFGWGGYLSDTISECTGVTHSGFKATIVKE